MEMKIPAAIAAATDYGAPPLSPSASEIPPTKDDDGREYDDGASRPLDKPHQHPRSYSSLTSRTASTVTNSGSESSSSSDDDDDDEAASSAPAVAAAAERSEVNNFQKKCNVDDNSSLDEYFDETRIERMNERAKKENGRLNLNLGLPVDLTVLTRRDASAVADVVGPVQKVLRPPVRVLVRLLDVLLSFVESPLFRFWGDRVPLKLRQRLTFLAWGMYLPIHKVLIGRRTGLHRDVSLEYHALTSVMWWGRLFPVTIKRMRFSLSQLHTCHPPDQFPSWKSICNSSSNSNNNALDDHNLVKPKNGNRYGVRGHVHEVYHRMEHKRTPTGIRTTSPRPSASEAEMTVTGLYVQHGPRPSRKVIMWIYGGAFLAGDSRGNLNVAEKMGMMCGDDDECGGGARDVFLPDYRLVPEYHLDDCVHDITLAYEYLIYERGVRPENVTLLGVSSGGGLVVLLMQALAKARREFDEREEEGEVSDSRGGKRSSCVPMPAGGVLMGPFVDYTEPKGSMKEYIKHDLIVNQSVFDENIHFLERVLGSNENRIRASPVYGNFEGLPPLCICVSEHEVVYDQSMTLAKRAKAQGADVTIGVWKYMCHVFPLLCPFVPEGQESFNFMCEWIKER